MLRLEDHAVPTHQGDLSPVTRVELTPADRLHIADFTGDGLIDIAALDLAAGALTFAFSTP